MRKIEHDMSSFLRECVTRYTSLAGETVGKLKHADTPFIAEIPEANDSRPEGKLKPHASQVLMKILYAARMARFDPLRAVNSLATKVTKWDIMCDKMLNRLVCYINSSLDVVMCSWIGNKKGEINIHLFADADFAGPHEGMKSTSGV